MNAGNATSQPGTSTKWTQRYASQSRRPSESLQLLAAFSAPVSRTTVDFLTRENFYATENVLLQTLYVEAVRRTAGIPGSRRGRSTRGAVARPPLLETLYRTPEEAWQAGPRMSRAFDHLSGDRGGAPAAESPAALVRIIATTGLRGGDPGRGPRRAPRPRILSAKQTHRGGDNT